MEATSKKRFAFGRLLRSRSSGSDRLANTVRLTLFIFVFLALGIAATNALLSQRIARKSELSTLTLDLSDFSGYLQKMRIEEKDFLRRHTQAYLDRHEVLFKQAQASLARARDNAVATPEERKTIDELIGSTNEYRKKVVAMSETQAILGNKEDAGVQGKLRDTANAAEWLLTSMGSGDLEVGMLVLRRDEKDFILREREEYVAMFTKAMADMNQRVQTASRLDAGTRLKLTAILTAYAGEFNDYVTGVRALAEEATAAQEIALSAQSPLPDLLQELEDRRTTYQTGTNRIQLATTVGLALVLLVVGGMLLSAMRSANVALAERLAGQKKAEAENDALNNSVISILEAVNQLSQRDLTVRAPVTQDVIGTVSDSINALTEETSRVLVDVNAIAVQVATASSKVKTQGDLVSKTAEDERQNVGRMIDSLSESAQTTNEMAVLAEQSNRSAEQATQATDNALETVNGTVRGMESIRETISETEKRIKRLGERSQEITGIVNLINTISERTHVLALNASMQAAVAGEAGRGFAVVAEEVQRLAESSRNATQQIGTLVNNIQLETNETIATVNRTIGQVVQGSEQAQKAGEQMRRTQQITAELVAQVKHIARASELQQQVSAGLLKSVQHIGDSTQRTSEQIVAQNVETETLLDSAKRLVASVNVFKLPVAV
jgi:methyl-accepting chemotaxis protein